MKKMPMMKLQTIVKLTRITRSHGGELKHCFKIAEPKMYLLKSRILRPHFMNSLSLSLSFHLVSHSDGTNIDKLALIVDVLYDIEASESDFLAHSNIFVDCKK